MSPCMNSWHVRALTVLRAHVSARYTGEAPVVVFAAHMDHPGFEISDVSGALTEAKWMGGVEPDYFPGAKVKVFSDPPTTGVCVKTELQAERRRVDKMFLDLEGEVHKIFLHLHGAGLGVVGDLDFLVAVGNGKKDEL